MRLLPIIQIEELLSVNLVRSSYKRRYLLLATQLSVRLTLWLLAILEWYEHYCFYAFHANPCKTIGSAIQYYKRFRRQLSYL